MSAKEVRSTREEILVGKALTDRPRGFEVRARRLLDGRDPATQPLPEGFRRVGRDEVVDETPGLDQDVIARDQGFVGRQEPLRGTVLPVAAIGSGIPGGSVHEYAQGVSAWRRFPEPVASPIMRAFSDAISVPRDLPRSKTTERSAPRGRPARSWSTRRRTYSASETPSAAARARTRACRSESSEIWVRTIIVAPSCLHRVDATRRLAPAPCVSPDRGTGRFALHAWRLWRSIGAHHGGRRFGCLICTS